MPYISNVITTDPGQKEKAVEAIEVIANHSLEGLEATVQIVALIIHPENVRPMVGSAFTVTKRDTSANYVTQSNVKDHQLQM